MRTLDDIQKEIAQVLPLLNQQQIELVNGVVAGMTHVEAYEAAGYTISERRRTNEASARRTLRLAGVAKYRQLLEEYAWVSSGVSKAQVLNYYRDVMEGNAVEEKIVHGIGVVEVPVSVADRLKAADSLAKYHGMFIDRKEIMGGPIGVTFVDDVPEEDEANA